MREAHASRPGVAPITSIVSAPFAVEVLAVVAPRGLSAADSCAAFAAEAAIRRASSPSAVPQLFRVPLPPLVVDLWGGGGAAAEPPPQPVAGAVGLDPVLAGVLRAAAGRHGAVYPVPLPVAQTPPLVPPDWAAARLGRGGGGPGEGGAEAEALRQHLALRTLVHLPALSLLPRLDLLPHPPWPGLSPGAPADAARPPAPAAAASAGTPASSSASDTGGDSLPAAALAASGDARNCSCCDHGAAFLRQLSALVLMA